MLNLYQFICQDQLVTVQRGKTNVIRRLPEGSKQSHFNSKDVLHFLFYFWLSNLSSSRDLKDLPQGTLFKESGSSQILEIENNSAPSSSSNVTVNRLSACWLLLTHQSSYKWETLSLSVGLPLVQQAQQPALPQPCLDSSSFPGFHDLILRTERVRVRR